MAFPFDTIIDILRAGVSTITGGAVAQRTYTVDQGTGVNQRLSIFGELRIAETIRVVGTFFGGNGPAVDANFWTSTVVGTGTNVVGGGQCRMSTGTTANSSAALETVRSARYIASVPNAFRGVVQLTTAGTANNTRQWGAFDANNGFFFRLSGTTFSVVTRKLTVDTVVSSGSFNGASTTYAPDTNAHTWEIFWSNSRVYFTVDGTLIHTVSATASPASASLSLKAAASNANSGGLASNVVMDVRVAAISRLGSPLPRPTWKNVSAGGTVTLKTGPGTLYRIIVNNKTLATMNVVLYDATSATNPIIDLDVPATSVSTHELDLDFYTGLTLVTGAGAQSVTVVYD